MATEKVTSFFEQSWSPVTWLTPSITARDLENEILFTGAMNEIGWWRYKYTIEWYNKNINYCITVDWGATLDDGSRYQYITNELDSYPNKLDRRSVSSWVIDYNQIAKAVRDAKAEWAKEGTFWALVAWWIDYATIWLQFEDMKLKLDNIKIPDIKFPEVPKWLSIDDVERLLKQYDKNDEIDKVVSSVKSIREMTDILVEEHAIMKKTNDDIALQEAITELKEIHWKIWDFDTLVNNLSDLPDMIETYKELLKSINTNKSLDDKLVSIRLWVNDILSKLRK